jgi:hypothetical protein
MTLHVGADEKVFRPSRVEGLLLLAHLLGAIAAALSAISQALRLSQRGELWGSRLAGQQDAAATSSSTGRRTATSYFDT